MDQPDPTQPVEPTESVPTGSGPSRPSRKTVLRAALAVGASLPVAFAGVPALARTVRGKGGTPEPTPECDDGDDPTPPQTEGPYFRPNSPRRTSLLDGNPPGTRLTVTGYVFGLGCRPVAHALLDFWQADANGAYDNAGHRFRGHQFTDARGAFTLTTIVPGLYPGRTRHLHVKVQAPNRPVLTTQLYFPGEPRNNTDSIFDARLLMTMRTDGPVRQGSYDFVLNVLQQPDPTDPPTTPPPSGTAWRTGTTYRAGDRVTYGGRSYTCLQTHTSGPGWEPPNVPALWRAV
jgi:protocatechuate 3,4-dioxygenase beta subunit